MNIPTIEESLFQLNLTCSELLRTNAGIELRFFSLSADMFQNEIKGNYTFTFPNFIDFAVITNVQMLDVYGNRIDVDYYNDSATEVTIIIKNASFQSINNIIVTLNWNA